MSILKTYTFSIDKGVTNWIKVIAALMVLVHHYSQYAIRDFDDCGLLTQLFAKYAGSIGVALFFFFSGYGLMESELKKHLNFRQFFKRRFLKIYLPVMLVTILWIIICPLLANKCQVSFEEFDKMSPNWGGGMAICY